MRLTVIGCSGSFPGPDSPASCYLLEAPHEHGTYRLVLDLGSGALGPLQRHVDLDAVDAVVLSHLHADHCLDLCGYYVARRYHPTGPRPRLPVHGPHGTAGRMARAYDLDPDPGMREVFDFHDLREHAPLTLGPFTVTPARVAHPGEAYALRVTDGDRTLVYSGDTGPCAALVDLAREADVLLCEASFHDGRDAEPDLHLSGREAAEHAARAGVGRLVLTHLPPWNDRARTLAEARRAFDGPLTIAHGGLVVDV